MYVVFKDGGHQVRAEAGEEIAVEYREATPGDEIVFNDVLMISGENFQIGEPLVKGAKVVATVVGTTKADKVFGIKKRDNNNSQTRFGHRQKYTQVTIKEIVTG